MTNYERIHSLIEKLLHYSTCFILGDAITEVDVNEVEQRESYSDILNKTVMMNDEDPKWVKIVIFILISLTFCVFPICFIYYRFYH